MPNAAPDPGPWAAREVGLSPDATRAEIRAGLLREVTRDGFVPPPLRQQAWEILSAPRDSAPPWPPAALLAEEARLRGEIDDFAASFFATPVEVRRRRWQELSAVCAFSPPLAARLAALEPGLGLDLRPGDIGNPRTAQLASHVAGLFVLAPAARAAQRQAVLRSLQTDIAGWEETARQLLAVSPALAALEPTLLASILGFREQQQRLARLREGRQHSGRLPPARRAVAPVRPAPAPSSPSAGGGRALGWVAVVVIGIVVRVCIGGLGSRSSSPPPPQIDIPKFDPEEHERTRKMIEEIERLQRMNRENEEQNKKRNPRDEQERLRPGDAGPAPRRGP